MVYMYTFGNAHSRHRLISGPGLRLRVRDPLLPTLSASQLVADALLALGHHCRFLVRSFDRAVFLLSLIGRHFRALHRRETLRRDFTADNAAAEVVFAVFEVEEENLHASAVRLVGFLLVIRKHGRLDRLGEGENVFRRWEKLVVRCDTIRKG